MRLSRQSIRIPLRVMFVLPACHYSVTNPEFGESCHLRQLFSCLVRNIVVACISCFVLIFSSSRHLSRRIDSTAISLSLLNATSARCPTESKACELWKAFYKEITSHIFNRAVVCMTLLLPRSSCVGASDFILNIFRFSSFLKMLV